MMDLTPLFSPFNLGLVLATYVVVTSLRSWYRLRKLPGNSLARFSYIFMAKIAHSGRTNELYADLARQYGPLFVIGPNDIMTSDPDLIRRMSMARSPYKRSNWYKPLSLDPYVDSSVSALETAVHDRLKAKISFGYGGKENPELEGGVDSQLESLVQYLQEKYIKPGRPADLARVVQYFTLDSISRIAYGKEFGNMTNDADVMDLVSTLDMVMPSVQLFGDVPWLGAVFLNRQLLKIIGPKRTDKKGVGKMMGFVIPTSKHIIFTNHDLLGSLERLSRNGLAQTQKAVRI